MDPKLLALLALRGVATIFTLQGQAGPAQAISALIAAYRAGSNVDAHMQTIADALESPEGLTSSWDDITQKINSEVDEFLGRGAGGDPE